MTTAKIELKLGNFSFLGEGDQAWLSKELDKVLERVPQLGEVPSGGNATLGGGSQTKNPDVEGVPLASFLTSKNATTNQTKKFLATAVWLHGRGRNRLTTKDVVKALKDSNQTRIGNPADCLLKNIGKGFCEKDGSEFFVIGGGSASLN